jgi:benzoyl-CoA reductase/2-hydroxyglutaryl-CoA dehydratase subunit BcrC/BadD/HgdB
MSEKVERKEIKATSQMKEIMAEYFLEMDRAVKDGSKKIAWCTSVGPAELLRSFGFLVHFPENHGAMLGATRTANDYIPVANAMGYSPDICSYTTSDIGAYVKGETPLTRAYGIKSVPKPDVLVYNTNQCRDVEDWFSWYSKELNVPLIGISTPRSIGDDVDVHISGVTEQMKALVPRLQEISGQKFDIDELKRVVSLSLETSQLWKAVLDTAATVPSPLNFFDGTIHMGPAVVLRGTQTAVDYYKLLLAEMEEGIRSKVASIEGERFRLYWEGMPIWGKLRPLSKLFLNLRCCVAASTYCNSWIFEAFDPEDPFRSMAAAYTELFITRTEPVKAKYIEEMVRRFKLDGILFHDSKTCPANSNNRYGMPERLQKSLGIPTLTINGDLNDLRCYSEDQTRTSIEAFVEQLEEKERD